MKEGSLSCYYIIVHEYTWHFWQLLLSWSVMCVTTLHISMLCGLLVVKYTNKMLFQNLSGLFFLYQSWPRNGQFVLFVCWSLQSEHIFFCQFESCDRPLMNNNFFLLYEVPNKVKTFPIYIHIYMHFCSLYYIDSIKIMVWVDSDNIVHIQWEITLSNKLSQSSYN